MTQHSELSRAMLYLESLVPTEGIAAVYKKKGQRLWEHYQSRKLPSEPTNGQELLPLEPQWVHYGYDLIRKFVNDEVIEGDALNLLDQIIASHSLQDGSTIAAFPGQPNSPQRIIHDGWKAGTPTWIFMGRALTPDSVVHLGGGYVAVQRTVPDELYKMMDPKAAPATLWMAYNLKEQMGMTALTSNVIGPAVSFGQLWDAVNAAHGPLYKTGANDKYA